MKSQSLLVFLKLLLPFFFLKRKTKLECLRTEIEELKMKIKRNDKSLESANEGKEESVSIEYVLVGREWLTFETVHSLLPLISKP